MKKQNIIYLAGGLTAGLVLALVIMITVIPGQMMTEQAVPYDFETAVTKFEASVVAHGWQLPHVNDLQKSMAKFGKEVRSVKVFEICHPDHAYKILSRDQERIVSSMMPCRVAIYEKSDGKVYVSVMNTAIMSKAMGGIIAEVMADASKESADIVKSILIK